MSWHAHTPQHRSHTYTSDNNKSEWVAHKELGGVHFIMGWQSRSFQSITGWMPTETSIQGYRSPLHPPHYWRRSGILFWLSMMSNIKIPHTLKGSASWLLLDKIFSPKLSWDHELQKKSLSPRSPEKRGNVKFKWTQSNTSNLKTSFPS